MKGLDPDEMQVMLLATAPCETVLPDHLWTAAYALLKRGLLRREQIDSEVDRYVATTTGFIVMRVMREVKGVAA